MTKSQKIALAISEKRQRLNEIAGLSESDITEEIRSEADTLRTEFTNLETQYRSALIAESETSAEPTGLAGKESEKNGEQNEIRSLLDKVQLRHYAEDLKAGRERTEINELNSALEVRAAVEGGIVIPIEMLEVRADDTTQTAANDGSTLQRPILPRVFAAGGVLESLGVMLDSVPAGQHEYILMATGTDAEQKAEGAAVEADAATFTTQALKPLRLTTRYKWSIEEGARVEGLESVFRRDMSDSISEQMANQVLNGNGAGAQVHGILSRLAKPATINDTADFAKYAVIPGLGVDGKHASMVSEVNALTTVEAYQHSGTLFNAGSGESAREYLARQLGSMRSTSLMAVRTENSKTNQSDIILHSGSREGDSIACVWPGIEVILDRITGASKGEVAITAVTLWNAYLAFRSDAYKRVAVKSG